MTTAGKNRTWICAVSNPMRAAALGLFMVVVIGTARAQTYKVIYNFTGAGGGANPYTGLTIDRARNLYGTASSGGAGHGTVFKLKPVGSGWVFSPLYDFAGGSDGAFPYARLAFGPDGSLYGSTNQGADPGCANNNGCGTVFKLQPPLSVCKSTLCFWSETVLYRFTGGSDGGNPAGQLVFDSAGNIYGTTRNGGLGGCVGYGCGVVYKLTHSGANWMESLLYSFTGGSDEGLPDSGVIFDGSGNILGTTQGCLGNYGTVFQLTPAGSSWTYSTIYYPDGSAGACTVAGLILDQSGNIYTATALSAAAFELTFSSGKWTLTKSHDLGSGGADCGPQDSLLMDKAGNVYGTTYCGGPTNLGSVFKLTPSGGAWTYTDLHDFTGSEGSNPASTLVIDSNGNLYGTASTGGTGMACNGGCGVVFEITP